MTRDLLGPNGRLIVVSNRGPITFDLDDGARERLTGSRGPGGLVTALGDLGRHVPVSWVATALTPGDERAAAALDKLRDGGIAADGRLPRRVAEIIESRLPGQDLRLHYERLPSAVFEPYYRQVCNPFLWFVQHLMYAPAYRPNVDADLLAAWRTGYRPANERLADAAVAAAGRDERPVVLVQDYHLYLAPARIRERRPDATILHFTHIPWPPAVMWQMLPQGLRRAICEGLLGADIVGLQTDRYASQFLETVASFVRDAHVEPDGRSIAWRGRTVRVRSYPISVDPDALRTVASSPEVAQRVDRLRTRLARVGDAPIVVVRADRMEPSKNALRGFLAFEALLERRPELRGRVRFIAVQSPTRPGIADYDDYATAMGEVVARVNGLAEPDDQPIWRYDGSDYSMAIAALRLADVVLVNPIIDGMNLVAKEAVLVGERDPVLILSETAGAAEQLAADALSVAPADIVGTTDQLERALAMPSDERRARVRRLRASVREQDLEWWLERQLRDLAAVRRGLAPPSRRLRDQVRRVESPLG
ncbi:MAG TPA: trehalose-6-phosphate synthase [Candidatus Limnocylindrales bacterium]|nr:trehalose-6-phosphate synthase [Candidatus Limnocylindrales bacterium]